MNDLIRVRNEHFDNRATLLMRTHLGAVYTMPGTESWLVVLNKPVFIEDDDEQGEVENIPTRDVYTNRAGIGLSMIGVPELPLPCSCHVCAAKQLIER